MIGGAYCATGMLIVQLVSRHRNLSARSSHKSGLDGRASWDGILEQGTW